MLVFLIFALVVLVAYGFCICIAAYYWEKVPSINATSIVDSEITVIVACRNIADKTDFTLFQALRNQTTFPQEFIFVDDHSTDNTLDLLTNWCQNLPNARILNSPYVQGKKNALRYGVEQATTPYVLFTDIDTQPHENWIASVADYLRKNKVDMLILPVFIVWKKTNTIFEQLQAFEYAALQAITAGWAAYKHPIMCAGANLAVRRLTWLESVPDIHSDIPSGDDMFMLHSFKRRKLKIAFLKSQQASVWVLPATNLYALIRQRTRWAAKASAYTDIDTLAVGGVVFLANTSIFIVFMLTVFGNIWQVKMLFLCGFVVKYLFDVCLLCRVKNFFGLKNVYRNSLLLSLIYPIYTIIAVFIGFFRKKKW